MVIINACNVSFRCGLILVQCLIKLLLNMLFCYVVKNFYCDYATTHKIFFLHLNVSDFECLILFLSSSRVQIKR